MDSNKETKKNCDQCSNDSNCSDCQCSNDCDNCNRQNCTTANSCCSKCEVRGKLESYNWLEDIPGGYNDFEMVEVEFKNTRKGFYRNTNNLDLHIGDMVAVESNPGHDIGKVSMTGKLVALQMKKANLRPDIEFLRVFRKAKPSDLEKFEEAKAKENDTMIRSRKIAEDLNLNMKIGDVEYQGDGNKAIFYYIADERVDFRQLIKVLADAFKIRIEMKQIGARQEAGRIGGIGPCGRPLCCSSWMNNFVSVSTSAARHQDISLNPQKLAGQCAKLKCCLNFEVDTYVEAGKKMPPREVQLYTKDNTYFFFKADVFKREVTYSTDKSIPANLVTISAERVFEVMALNKQGAKPDKLQLDDKGEKEERKEFGDIIDQNSLTRFDKIKKKNRNKNSQRHNNQEAVENQNPNDNRRQNRPQHNGPKGQNSNENNGNNNNGNVNRNNSRRNRQYNNNRPRNGQRPNKGPNNDNANQ